MYIAINIINIDDIPEYLKEEVNATNFFCKRILSLTRILKQENIKIEVVKKQRLKYMLEKYMETDVNGFYFLPGDKDIYQLTCPYSVLLEAIDDIPEY
ncbi:MAG: hypothetical protein ACRCZI_00105 [Cetobacterium sp.]